MSNGPFTVVPGGMTFVRHRVTDRESIRKSGPKPADHPSIGMPCPACLETFREGDYTTLVPLGPGGDVETQETAYSGRWFNAVALECHYRCVVGRAEDDDSD